jgi:hypothetical protein
VLTILLQQPIFGGALGSWRLTFYFMGACGAASFVTFLFFKETFRTERSLAWQKARKEALEKAETGIDDSKTNTGILSKWGQSINTAKQNLTRRIQCIPLPWKKGKEEVAIESREKFKSTAVNAPFVPPEYQEAEQHNVDRTLSAPVAASIKNDARLSRSLTTWGTHTKQRPSLTRKVTTRVSINRVITSEGKEIKVSDDKLIKA